MVNEAEPKTDPKQTVLNRLLQKAVGGNLEAGAELSLIALGGDTEAQRLVKKMDEIDDSRRKACQK